MICTLIFFVAWVLTGTYIIEHWYHRDKHNNFEKSLLYIWGLVFVIFIDVPYNIVFGTLYFRQLPNKDGCGWTFTERLQHILKEEPVESWRWQHAYWICRYLISPWDFNHCGLGLGRE